MLLGNCWRCSYSPSNAAAQPREMFSRTEYTHQRNITITKILANVAIFSRNELPSNRLSNAHMESVPILRAVFFINLFRFVHGASTAVCAYAS
jgi:hypothetical protein